MRLLALLTVSTLLIGAALAGKASDDDYDLVWENCDNQPDGKTAETCCKAPSHKNYALKLLEPLNGTCINYPKEISFAWQVVDNPNGEFVQPTEPAFELILRPNPWDSPSTDGEGYVFTHPICVGDGSKLESSYNTSSDFLESIRKFKYSTWAVFLSQLQVPLPDRKKGYLIYDGAGATEDEGVWISENCVELTKDMCAGKVPNPPKDNHFYKYSMTRCEELGITSGGGSSGKGKKGKKGHGHH